ncbi:ABC transporter ATP-binding protein [Peptoniphilus sp. oral taxon 386]|uniref:ABC transporter ATP-binding protein n=1 Tax=Peptoniphilus sp. oral taxon 386 TaxID=652713 RepID=UPI0001DA9B39|nr:ABC transporter ATP-binding protein [Peptoniphilus sp. oral taxon 386]EFI42131.1 ABC transporter, ATP-binding protein [Peptoniphilus sp. oral taxon 386 str. F0131]
MLKIENLIKKYGNKEILHGINLEIESGDIFGFIGKNGAGKTTTIKCVVGLIEYDSGNILINGMDNLENSLECKKITAYIPDNPELYEFMNGIDYLNFIADAFDVKQDIRMERIVKYSKIFDIHNNLNESISTYSHGMKQKLAIISALIHEPKLLILDEPFVGLDPTATHYLKEEFKNMCQRGTAIFFSTHVLEVAQNLCNKIAIIKDGNIIETGLTNEVTKKSSLEDIFLELMKDEIR